MRRLVMMVVAVAVTAGLLAGCAKEVVEKPATPKPSTAAPAKK